MKKAIKKSARSAAASITSLPVRGHRVGRVVEVRDGAWLVECVPDAAPIRARTTLQLSLEAMQAAASARSEALIVFENESADRPIVVGLMAPAPSPQVDAVVDGRRVTLEGKDEIVLRCGPASITLRRNGRVVIRGAYVETRAQGVNRIKGGSVLIN